MHYNLLMKIVTFTPKYAITINCNLDISSWLMEGRAVANLVNDLEVFKASESGRGVNTHKQAIFRNIRDALLGNQRADIPLYGS